MIDLVGKLTLRAFDLIESRLSIVLFHRVLAAPDALLPDEPDVTRFADQVSWLKRCFRILPLREALELLAVGRLPPGTVCITFDDGYLDNYTHALPILRRFGASATFFVTTRHLDGGMMWNDRVIEAVRHWSEPQIDLSAHGLPAIHVSADRAGVANHLLGQLKYLPYAERDALADELFERSGAAPRRLMMNADEVRAMHAAGMEIGGHTVSHPILCAIDEQTAATEIAANKATLEGIIGAPVETFAYPNGRPRQDYDTRHVALVRSCGYRWAVSTAAGTATRRTSAWQVPRFTPWDRAPTKYLARMMHNYFRNAAAVPEPATAM